MNTKNKLKVTEAEAKNTNKPVLESGPLVAKELAELKAEQKEFWQAAITELQSGSYANIDDAVEKVAQLVITKLKLPESVNADIKQLLLTAFETDPVLSEQLKAGLKIR